MKKVIITVDTEGHDGEDPIKHLIWGITADGHEFGINRIMDICDRFSAKGLFFVDIAEAWDYGREQTAAVIRHIRKRGHDVGVHIHPDHMADPNRFFLWEYTKEEQFEIIKKCTDFYTEITGEPPIAFRAGKYGANYDTLAILDELGYNYDFSQFYGQKWCGINPPAAITVPQRIKGLIEIPVTIFRSFRLGTIMRYDKLDAEEIDISEFKHIMGQISRDKRDIIVSLFFHSFSMLHWRMQPDKPAVNLKKEEKFIKTLEYINHSREFEFIGLDDLLTVCNVNLCENQDDEAANVIAAEGLIRTSWFTIKRAYGIRKTNRKAQWLIYGGAALLIMLVLIVTLLCSK